MDSLTLHLLPGLCIEIVFIIDVLMLRLLRKKAGGFRLRLELKK